MFITTSPHHTLHAPTKELYNGNIECAADQAQRMDVICHALQRAYSDTVITTDLLEVDDKVILEVHTAEYIDYLKSRTSCLAQGEEDFLNDVPYLDMSSAPRAEQAKKGYFCSDTYTTFTRDIRQVAKSSYQSVHTAGLHALETGEYTYAMTRPSGHHALPGRASGYCYLANASIFAKYLRGLGKKVGILDIDFHHGNGAQLIFYTDEQVITTSLHADPARKFPYFTGYADEKGRELGYNKNLNIPLGPDIGDAEYLTHLARSLQFLSEENIDFLIVSVGFDISATDPICDFSISLEGFTQIGNMICGCDAPTLFVQEGGYNLETLGNCATHFFAPFLD